MSTTFSHKKLNDINNLRGPRGAAQPFDFTGEKASNRIKYSLRYRLLNG